MEKRLGKAFLAFRNSHHLFRKSLMQITFRGVQPADDQFIFEVYSSSREQEMALVPWNDAQREAFLRMQCAAQLSHYQKHHPKAEHAIILEEGSPVGRIYIDRAENKIEILDLTILTAHRGKGTGSYILKQLQDESRKVNKPLNIYVESFNPSLALFERLGFKKKSDEGINFLMEWNPSGSLHVR
jgi:GNAT superfamily N-acetyltransferase